MFPLFNSRSNFTPVNNGTQFSEVFLHPHQEQYKNEGVCTEFRRYSSLGQYLFPADCLCIALTMSGNPSVVLRKVGEIVLGERPEPQITDERSVKIAIKRTGICGSDIHYYTHGKIGSFVVEVGSKVTKCKLGDRVAIEPGVPSRYSDEYKSGHYNLCPHMAFAATPPFDGTLCRYYLSPEDFVVVLPDNVSLDQGAMAEPLSVAVHASKLGGVHFNSSVAVFGAGPVGLLSAACARAMGATQVLVADIFDSKLDIALNMGATHVLNTKNVKDVRTEVEKLLGNYPDVVIEASGAEIAIINGVKILKAGGTFVQVGMGKDLVQFPIGQVAEKELTVKGNFRYCHGDYRDAVALMASGKVNIEPIITHRFAFKNAKDAYDFNLHNGKDVIKTIIEGPEESHKL